ncbi:retrovirus-related Pol polyprotein from transposon opus [Trichonephila clavipes]|nr:retrovirus-related Pol polyprotein from transposon opus [Trichonephila clavipes]
MLEVSRAVGSLVVRTSDSRPEGRGSMPDTTKDPPSTHGFPCRNCGGGDRGGVAIYRPFGEFRRAKIALSPVWCSRPTTGVPLAHATMNFVGLDLTTSDRWHQKTTTTRSLSTVFREILGKGLSGSASHPTEKGDAFPRLEEGNVPINTSCFGEGKSQRVQGAEMTQIFYPTHGKDFNLSGLDSKIRSRLFQLLISHKSAFARSTVELSAAATEHHRISLQHDYPIKCPIYKIPFNLRNEFRRQIADLEKAGIISKSNSQYNTPALFVKQKEKWRLVLDFWKLNEITVTQDFVIPTLDDILHEISGSNYFSALDMKSAFNQIPLHFADRHKTAFSTPDGDKYQFNILCFGL